ncbi:MAG: DUF2400 domain-containing protein [Cellulosilyticum sp.]|nr:DUF2400 domain-containing protein [Cellulosilyticum sp.]
MDRREAFKRWLQNTRIKKSGKPIPEKVIDNYLKNIHRVSDAMYETGVISKRLYSMRTVEELTEAMRAIQKDRTYLTLNTKNENMCQKALQYYMTFTEDSCREE